ncbi:hypothetical protein GN956_G22315 [Arapaima gigas]
MDSTPPDAAAHAGAARALGSASPRLDATTLPALGGSFIARLTQPPPPEQFRLTSPGTPRLSCTIVPLSLQNKSLRRSAGGSESAPRAGVLRRLPVGSSFSRRIPRRLLVGCARPVPTRISNRSLGLSSASLPSKTPPKKRSRTRKQRRVWPRWGRFKRERRTPQLSLVLPRTRDGHKASHNATRPLREAPFPAFLIP